MKNEFHKISIKTGVGNIPQIIEYNNQCVSDEFDLIRNSDYKVILDVSTDVVNARNSKITNLTVNSLNITDKSGNGVSLEQYVSNIVNNNPKVADVQKKSSVLEYAYSSVSNNPGVNPQVYGASVDEAEYDMSSFFSSSPKGIMKNLTVSDLYHVKLYRTLDNFKIPLNVGSIVIGEKFRIMLYHDHIVSTPAKKKIERVYVAVVDGADKNSVIQYAPAGTIALV